MPYIGKSPSSGVRNRFIYTATAGQTTFSGTDDHNRTLSYTDAEFTDVFLNGVKLDKSDYTATSGTSIVLDSGAAVGDTLEVLAFDTFSVFSGNFSQDVSVGGDLTVDTDTLHVDSTNNRVGVGTASPAFALDVQSASDPAEIRLKEDGNTNGLRITNFDGDEAQINNADNGPLVFKTNNLERARVLSDGKVGIGTTTAEATLDVMGNSDSVAALKLNGGNDNHGFHFYTTASEGDLAIKREVAGTQTEVMRIQRSSGTVCVNTTAGEGAAKLSVLGNSSSPGISVRNSGGSGLSLISFINSTNASFIGSITNASDNSVAYNTTSDYRLKENLSLISDAITRVKKLKSYRFNFISSPSTTVDGFLAHEAQTVVPEAVTGTKDQTETVGDLKDADGNVTESKVVKPDTLQEGYTWTETETRPVYQGIDQAKLVPLLTAALQEAIAKIETLETKVAALEAE